MNNRVRVDVITDGDVLATVEPLRRVVRARVSDPDAAEDVVQETLARLLETRHRLDRPAVLAYGIAVARNLIASLDREQDRHRKHAHRLHEPPTSATPDEVVLLHEEEAAIGAAVTALPAEERWLLTQYEVSGRDTASLATEGGASAGAVSARLARARARLRVQYLLALRNVDLPTPHCRSVLLALSSGDQRRQRGVGASSHLLTCRTCAGLSPPLVERRRQLAAFVPWFGLGAALEPLRAWVARHPVQASLTAAGTSAAVATAVVASGALSGGQVVAQQQADSPVAASAQGADGTDESERTGTLRLPDGSPVPINDLALGRHVGTQLSTSNAPVLSVPADEGFWLGESTSRRVWVQLTNSAEQDHNVRPGDRVSFDGEVVSNPPGFAERVGVNAAEGAAQLGRQGAHIAVRSWVLEEKGS